jgi:hypothetical protein
MIGDHNPPALPAPSLKPLSDQRFSRFYHSNNLSKRVPQASSGVSASFFRAGKFLCYTLNRMQFLP